MTTAAVSTCVEMATFCRFLPLPPGGACSRAMCSLQPLLVKRARFFYRGIPLPVLELSGPPPQLPPTTDQDGLTLAASSLAHLPVSGPRKFGHGTNDDDGSNLRYVFISAALYLSPSTTTT